MPANMHNAVTSYTASMTSAEPSEMDPEERHGHSYNALLQSQNTHLQTPENVFSIIQRCRQEVLNIIDTTLTYDQLKQPTLNFSVVRPLTVKLSKGPKPATSLIYALLVNRVQFNNDADSDLAFAGINTTRADLCELLAVKLLSAYGSNIELMNVLTTAYNPFVGATREMFEDGVEQTDLETMLEKGKMSSSNALELAIFSKAKRFVRSPLVQQFIQAIYSGEILYVPYGANSIIRDEYKSRPVVEIYDWRRQPFLDHYRLRVPRIRNLLELFTFGTILVLFIVTQLTQDHNHLTLWEGLFIFWSLGFTLDELASVQENGLTTYFYGVYNAMDSMFCMIFATFLGLRVYALISGDPARSELAFDTLSLAGCILFPRLSISLIKGNVVLLALSAMTKEFILFMGLASLTASGFLCTLYVLADGSWSLGRISWLMLKIWLGNSFLGFEAAKEFHPIFGPTLIVFFAILSQTLLLTILISLLSNTFASVQANAETEILNQKALRTLERVKSDALTSYTPPFNLVAFVILVTLRNVVSPRYFHKVNVFLIRLFNLPVLLVIALNTRLQHARHNNNFLLNAAYSTNEALRKLPSGIPWEGPTDSVADLFERELTEVAFKVPFMDEADSKSFTNGQSTSDAKLKKVKTMPSNYSRSHARMGSLVSPLAKIFTSNPIPESVPVNKSSDVIPQGHQRTLAKSFEPTAAKDEEEADGAKNNLKRNFKVAENSQGIDARLEAIEKALAFLIGEITKSNGDMTTTEGNRPPLTSLTGEVEQSYAGKDD